MEANKGVWEFDVLAEENNVDLFKTKDVCTHQLPNKI